jgi:hypothetical protein
MNFNKSVLLYKLSLVSDITAGKTISTSDPDHWYLLEHKSWSSSIWRTYSGEKRKDTVEEIEKLFKECFQLLSENTDQEIIDALRKARFGFSMLKNTYEKDYSIIGKIESILQDSEKALEWFALEHITTTNAKENALKKEIPGNIICVGGGSVGVAPSMDNPAPEIKEYATPETIKKPFYYQYTDKTNTIEIEQTIGANTTEVLKKSISEHDANVRLCPVSIDKTLVKIPDGEMDMQTTKRIRNMGSEKSDMGDGGHGNVLNQGKKKDTPTANMCGFNPYCKPVGFNKSTYAEIVSSSFKEWIEKE